MIIAADDSGEQKPPSPNEFIADFKGHVEAAYRNPVT